MSKSEPYTQSVEPRRRPDNRVGPVLVSDETVRTQLLTGRVLTFRPDRRTVGETHARWSPTGSKKADVVVREREYIDPSDPQALLPYRKLSGFAAVEEWQSAIKDIHDGFPEGGWIYDVVLLDTEPGVESSDEWGYDAAGVWECSCGEEFIVTEKIHPLQFALQCPNHPDH